MRRVVALLCVLSLSSPTLAAGFEEPASRAARGTVIFASAFGRGRIEVERASDGSGRTSHVVYRFHLPTGETEEFRVDLESQKVHAFDLDFTAAGFDATGRGPAGFFIEGFGQIGFVNISQPSAPDDRSLATDLLSRARMVERANKIARFLAEMQAQAGRAGRVPQMACAVAGIAGAIAILSVWTLTGACAVATGGACLGAIGSAVSGTIYAAAQIGDSCG